MAHPRVGDYELVRPLGAGGMGRVHEARHPELPGRRLALKQLPDGSQDPELRQRFRREAELLARVRHPGVVTVHAVGDEPGGPFLVMDLVEGESLEALWRRGPLPPPRALALIEALGEALAAVHRAGVVHRDLKPENVILRPDGVPVLVDFGLARSDQAQRLTQTGTILGTPAYMPPELARGEGARADARADVYGLAAVLFALLTGSPPFCGGGVLEVLRKVLGEAPAWPGRGEPGGDVPPALRAAVEAALAKDPADRPADVGALLASLRSAGGAKARRRLWSAAGVALVGLALAGWLAASPRAPQPEPLDGRTPPTARVEVAPPPLPAPPAPLPSPAPEGAAWVTRGEWQGARFCRDGVLAWRAGGVALWVSAPGGPEPRWWQPRTGALLAVAEHPDGRLILAERGAGGTALSAVDEATGELVWEVRLLAEVATGLAVWPDLAHLAVGVQDARPVNPSGSVIVLAWSDGHAVDRGGLGNARGTSAVGEVAALGSRLVVASPNETLGELNALRVFGWGAAAERLDEPGRLQFLNRVQALCAGEAGMWVGDAGGRVHWIERPRLEAAADVGELLQLEAPDIAERGGSLLRGGGAHGPDHRVVALRAAPGGLLLSLAEHKKTGVCELRCWDTAVSPPRQVGRITGLPARGIDLSPDGAWLLLTLPDGVLRLPTGLCKRGTQDWPDVLAAAVEAPR